MNIYDHTMSIVTDQNFLMNAVYDVWSCCSWLPWYSSAELIHTTRIIETRKLCYRKDDRAMRRQNSKQSQTATPLHLRSRDSIQP